MSTGKRRAKNYLLIPLVSKIVGKVNVNIVDKCATGQLIRGGARMEALSTLELGDLYLRKTQINSLGFTFLFFKSFKP